MDDFLKKLSEDPPGHLPVAGLMIEPPCQRTMMNESLIWRSAMSSTGIWAAVALVWPLEGNLADPLLKIKRSCAPLISSALEIKGGSTSSPDSHLYNHNWFSERYFWGSARLPSSGYRCLDESEVRRSETWENQRPSLAMTRVWRRRVITNNKESIIFKKCFILNLGWHENLKQQKEDLEKDADSFTCFRMHIFNNMLSMGRFHDSCTSHIGCMTFI